MMKSTDPHIVYSQEAGVFTLRIDRPEKKNALTRNMYGAMAKGIILADRDDAVSVIVITGCEDCFTSGNDINDFLNAPDLTEERPSVQFMKAISQAEKPLVAAVGGLAVGIGTTLLLHCDLVYAARDCFFQLPFARLGLCPEAGSSLLLPALMGHHRASELLLLGERFDAETACRFGLVNEVLPRNEYFTTAMHRARQLASYSPKAVQTSKRLIKRRSQGELMATIDIELAEFGKLLGSEEAQAILQQFLSGKKATG
ncbi:MAG: enoyl-CoA hydratase [Pseudohongiellaceae bacterium]